MCCVSFSFFFLLEKENCLYQFVMTILFDLDKPKNKVVVSAFQFIFSYSLIRISFAYSSVKKKKKKKKEIAATLRYRNVALTLAFH